MKIFNLLGVMIVLSSTVACADSKTVAQTMLKPFIAQQCQSELKNAKIWQVTSLFWQEKRKLQVQDNICSCVADNALNQVGNKELITATVDEEAKNKLIKKAIMNSLQACSSKILE